MPVQQPQFINVSVTLPLVHKIKADLTRWHMLLRSVSGCINSGEMNSPPKLYLFQTRPCPVAGCPQENLEPALFRELSREKRMAKALLEVSDARKEEYPQGPRHLGVFWFPFPRALRQ